MPATFTPIGNLHGNLTSESGLSANLSGSTVVYGVLDFGEHTIPANTVFTYKGSVTDISSLPATAENGDAYYVESDTTYYAWMGERWQDIGAGTMTEDLTAAQIAELQGLVE